MEIRSITSFRDNFKRNVEILFAIILGLLTIVLILYLLYAPNYSAPFNETENPIPLTVESLTTKGKTKLIEVLDPNIVEYGDKKLTLPEGWIITSKYTLSIDSQLSCVGKEFEDCTVTEISGNGETYYISEVKLEFPAFQRLDKSGRILQVGSKSVEFEERVYEFLKLPEDFDIDKAQEQTTKIESQATELPIYLTGCVDTSLCIATQTLPNIDEENQAEIVKFEEFLKSLSI